MEEKKFPGPLEALIVILIVFFLIMAGVLIIYLVLFLSGQSDPEMVNPKYIYILGSLPYIIIPFYYAKYKNYNLTELFRFKPVPLYTVILSIIIGLSLSIVADEIDRLTQIIIETPDFILDTLKSMRAETTQDWILLFLGVVVFAAVSEEMVFRGFLQVTLEKTGDVTKAVLMASFAWTLIHVNPFWAIQIFIMGVIIGFLAWRTGSIVPAIIVHGINNFVSLLYYNYEPELDWYTMGNHVTPEVLIPALAVLVYSIIKLSDYYQRKSDIDLRL